MVATDDERAWIVREWQVLGQEVELLADARGQVLLVGDRLFWSSAEPDRTLAGLRIQARELRYTV